MRVVMISGCRTYEDLVRDFGAWRDLHRPLPDAIVVPHNFVSEVLVNVDDSRRLAFGTDADVVYFMSTPVICMCRLHAQTVDITDCPLTGHEHWIDPAPAEQPESTVDTPAPAALSKKAAKAAKPKSTKRR